VERRQARAAKSLGTPRQRAADPGDAGEPRVEDLAAGPERDPIPLTDLVDPEQYPRYAALCLKIVTKGGKKIPLELNFSQRRVQAAIETCRKQDRPPRLVVLKARQTGISTDIEGRLFHAAHLKPDRTAVVMAHKRESAAKIFRMTRRYLDLLPKSAKPDTLYHTKDSIVFDHNGSSLQVVVADEGAGRGITAQYVHLSEYAFMREPDKVLAAVLQAVPDQVDSLVVIESTACGMNSFYDLWVQAKTGQSDFMPIFIPWFEDPDYKMKAAFSEAELDEPEKELLHKYRLSLD
jgi:hypothetical protein